MAKQYLNPNRIENIKPRLKALIQKIAHIASELDKLCLEAVQMEGSCSSLLHIKERVADLLYRYDACLIVLNAAVNEYRRVESILYKKLSEILDMHPILPEVPDRIIWISSTYNRMPPISFELAGKIILELVAIPDLADVVSPVIAAGAGPNLQQREVNTFKEISPFDFKLMNVELPVSFVFDRIPVSDVTYSFDSPVIIQVAPPILRAIKRPVLTPYWGNSVLLQSLASAVYTPIDSSLPTLFHDFKITENANKHIRLDIVEYFPVIHSELVKTDIVNLFQIEFPDIIDATYAIPRSNFLSAEYSSQGGPFEHINVVKEALKKVQIWPSREFTMTLFCVLPVFGNAEYGSNQVDSIFSVKFHIPLKETAIIGQLYHQPISMTEGMTKGTIKAQSINEVQIWPWRTFALTLSYRLPVFGNAEYNSNQPDSIIGDKYHIPSKETAIIGQLYHQPISAPEGIIKGTVKAQSIIDEASIIREVLYGKDGFKGPASVTVNDLLTIEGFSLYDYSGLPPGIMDEMYIGAFKATVSTAAEIFPVSILPEMVLPTIEFEDGLGNLISTTVVRPSMDITRFETVERDGEVAIQTVLCNISINMDTPLQKEIVKAITGGIIGSPKDILPADYYLKNKEVVQAGEDIVDAPTIDDPKLIYTTEKGIVVDPSGGRIDISTDIPQKGIVETIASENIRNEENILPTDHSSVTKTVVPTGEAIVADTTIDDPKLIYTTEKGIAVDSLDGRIDINADTPQKGIAEAVLNGNIRNEEDVLLTDYSAVSAHALVTEAIAKAEGDLESLQLVNNTVALATGATVVAAALANPKLTYGERIAGGSSKRDSLDINKGKIIYTSKQDRDAVYASSMPDMNIEGEKASVIYKGETYYSNGKAYYVSEIIYDDKNPNNGLVIIDYYNEDETMIQISQPRGVRFLFKRLFEMFFSVNGKTGNTEEEAMVTITRHMKKIVADLPENDLGERLSVFNENEENIESFIRSFIAEKNKTNSA